MSASFAIHQAERGMRHANATVSSSKSYEGMRQRGLSEVYKANMTSKSMLRGSQDPQVSLDGYPYEFLSADTTIASIIGCGEGYQSQKERDLAAQGQRAALAERMDSLLMMLEVHNSNSSSESGLSEGALEFQDVSEEELTLTEEQDELHVETPEEDVIEVGKARVVRCYKGKATLVCVGQQ